MEGKEEGTDFFLSLSLLLPRNFGRLLFLQFFWGSGLVRKIGPSP